MRLMMRLLLLDAWKRCSSRGEFLSCRQTFEGVRIAAMAWAVLIPLWLAATLFAQEPRANGSPVEVASVKENRSGTTAAGGGRKVPGRFSAFNMTLRLLVNAA